jgi:polyhydroxyalkanoate synthesis regulator phasin
VWVSIDEFTGSDTGRETMDEKQKRQINEAAEKFADALKESYQSIADRSVSAQELNAQVTQDFFNGVINNLRTQADNNRALSEDLIEQQRKQQEASRALARESVNAYMDFLNSMFSYYRANLDEVQRRANQ